MKKTKENLEHRIQLKEDEIYRYTLACKNYPHDRMERYGKPYLQKLNNELSTLKSELEDRNMLNTLEVSSNAQQSHNRSK